MDTRKRMTAREILVTHALPYANGPLHIGHMLGYIQTDIWVRARRMAGDTVYFVAADDVHGTPIMLAAEKAGKTPEDFIAEIEIGHRKDFKDFGVDHDYYYTTHSPENKELAERIYRALRDAKPSHIATRAVRQFYDPVKQMFLPDRYIKGTCPNCGTPDQYGDNCENCGATYAPTDLIDPKSVVSGATPELRDSEHYFFKLGDFADFLRNWLSGDVAHSSVKAKLKEWLDADGGLRDWDISRDAPYFGFPIPDAPGKFFYVWLDAPVGYLASFKKYCATTATLGDAYFDDFMRPGSVGANGLAREMHHFIGKDIVNFHGLFWPAMLEGAKLRTPNALHVNGYLTVNGEKMSKSRGTFIMARTYLDAGLNPDYLRYYFATMLGAQPTDVDLDLKTFVDVVNSHIVGKFINIASRCAKLLESNFANRLGDDFWSRPGDVEPKTEDALICFANINNQLKQTAILFESCAFSEAVTHIIRAADYANEYIATAAPWALARDPHQKKNLHVVLTAGINMFRMLAAALSPIVPNVARWAADYLCLEKAFSFTDFALSSNLANKTLKTYEPTFTRIDSKLIDTMIENSKDSLQASTPAQPAKHAAAPTAAPNAASTISIDDFAKLDLRIAHVLACEFVDGSDKLLRFELDAGDLGKRQIFSGIRAAYQSPEKLVGRKVVFIANLAPRKMRFGVSEGMILSAGSGGDQLFLLDADEGAQPGMPVK
ncbi:MAG TPA: methionine--tRNA ligase [Rudaea sp.]|jgi:methionyl-tRNA synthetase|nr:methionine--tRNA ligase [Rudaea sp.]